MKKYFYKVNLLTGELEEVDSFRHDTYETPGEAWVAYKKYLINRQTALISDIKNMSNHLQDISCKLGTLKHIAEK